MAEALEVNVLLRFMVRRDSAILELLLVTLICLVYGIGETVRGTVTSLLYLSAIAGALSAWGLGGLHLSGKRAWTVISILGLFGAWVRIGQLGESLITLVLSISNIPIQFCSWAGIGIPTDFSAVTNSWGIVTVDSAALSARLIAWLGSLIHGQTVNDPAIRALVWTLTIWFMAAWGGWMLRRKHQALIATAPSAALLAAVLDYSGGKSNAHQSIIWLLVIQMAAILLLMGLSRQDAQEVHWKQRSVDYAESIAFDSGMAVGLLTLGLTISAAIIPSISVREIADRLRDRGRESQNQDNVARSLGLDPAPSEFDSYAAPGLPNRHLVRTPPELLKREVMTVHTSDMHPIFSATELSSIPRYYWRSTTYDIYTGIGWATSATESVNYGADEVLIAQPPAFYRVIEQDVQRSSSSGNQLYWVGVLRQADQPIEAAWRSKPANRDSFLSADMFGALIDADFYRADSLIPNVSIEALRAAPIDYQTAIRQRYLQLPDSIPERVLSLALDLTATSPTPYDRAKAIETYLRSYPYTLAVPPVPTGRDVVDYFLFDLKKGYCDYYASAMVVLARAAGLPARLVNGYASGTYDMQNARYIVEEGDAHAWPEIYFTGIGWIEFEPTAALPEIEHPLHLESSSSSATSGPADGRSNPLSHWSEILSLFLHRAFLTPIILALAVLFWLFAESWILACFPASVALSLAYRNVYRIGRRLVEVRSPGTTAGEFAELLEERCSKAAHSQWLAKFVPPGAAEVNLLTEAYLRSLFSAHPPTYIETRRALRAWSRLRWRLLAARLLPQPAGDPRQLGN
jgi:transglutaminase-like putative cysteine protease